MIIYSFGVALFMLVCAVPTQAQTDGAAADALDSLLSMPINSVSKSWQNIKVAPASVTIVTDRDIRRFGYRTLEDVLRATRSFYTGYDRNYSSIGVRGFSRPADYNNRVLVLFNGHYVNENVFGSAGFGYDLPLNFDAVERIEIVRGPGSAAYGTGAMFAVINIITKSGQQLDGVSGSAELGSFGRRQAQVYAGREFDNGWNLAASLVVGDADGPDLYYEEFDNDSTGDGMARNLDGTEYYAAHARVQYRSVALQSYYSFRQKDIPTASFATVFNHPGVETRDSYVLVEARYEEEASEEVHLLLRANYNLYEYTGQYFYPETSPDSTTNTWVGGEVQVRWDMAAWNRVIAGIEYRDILRADYRNWFDGTLLFSRDVPFTVLSGYLQNEYQAYDNLNITAGLRADYNSGSGTVVSPRLGVIWNSDNETTLKLLYGTAFRSPNFSEMYVMFSGDSKDNPNLKPENITTVELVAERRLGGDVYAVASAYYNRMSNLIDQQVDPVDSLLQYTNRAAAQAVGMEVELSTRTDVLRSYLSYTLQSATDVESGVRLSNSPVHLLKAGASLQLLPPLTLALDASWESARHTVYNTGTDPFVLMGLNIVYQPVEFAELSVQVRNVLNTSYALPGGFEHTQRSIAQDGRTVAAKIRLVW